MKISNINYSINQARQNNQNFGTLKPHLTSLSRMDVPAALKIERNLSELEQLAEGLKVTLTPKRNEGIKQILVSVESETQNPSAGKNVVAEHAVDVKQGFIAELKTIISSLGALKLN